MTARPPPEPTVYHSNEELPNAARGFGTFGHEVRWSKWCPICSEKEEEKDGR